MQNMHNKKKKNNLGDLKISCYMVCLYTNVTYCCIECQGNTWLLYLGWS